MSATVTLRIREEDHLRLKALAVEDRRSVTATVTVLVDEEVQRRQRAVLPGDLPRPGIAETRREPLVGSVAEKNEGAARRGSVAVDPDPFHALNETTAREVARGRAEDAARPVDRTKPLTSPVSYDRLDETRCGRCGVPWKNHQEGSRKNRAGTTGCTTFEDPS